MDVQLAVQRPEAIIKIIAIDRTIKTTTWIPADKNEQQTKANEVVIEYGPSLVMLKQPPSKWILVTILLILHASA